MKVWTIHHESEGRGWTSNTPVGFDEEVNAEIENTASYTHPQDRENPWKSGEREKFNISIAAMEIGQEIERGCLYIRCEEMTEEAFNGLPEWDGW